MEAEWARISGKDAFGRPAALLAEPRNSGTRVLVSTPPAGVLLDHHELDLLIERLGHLRNGMPGTRNA
ncbi:hypothetical protein [Lentzea albidocapillata]|uniref:Uncharacterized protein n=1 Tax=Lentzea albidocapillata TaxID=40571 RepID=A0A1W2FQJ9_9PSEU|nr:hypothetical protein [Lentzea albidocapillata]SMD24215.1 hypothetical protein SAMN05660733_07677 [Lentzea albidocapillata]